MKKQFLLILGTGFFLLGVAVGDDSAIAQQSIFTDDFDTHHNENWTIVNPNWSYVLNSGTDYFFNGIGDSKDNPAISTPSNNTIYNKAGLSVEVTFELGHNNRPDNSAGIFFDDPTNDGFNIGIYYDDTGIADITTSFMLFAMGAGGNENGIILEENIGVKRIDTTFKLVCNINLQSELDITIYDLSNGSPTVPFYQKSNVDLHEVSNSGIIGLYTNNFADFHLFQVAGINDPQISWNLFMPAILNKRK